MRLRLNMAVTSPTSALYTWYINIKTTRGASANIDATPRIIFYSASGSKNLDLKALKSQQGHNSIFWRALLPVRGVGSTIVCFASLLGIILCGGVYLFYLAHAKLYLPVAYELTSLTPLSAFILISVFHLAWHLKKRGSALPICSKYLFCYVTSTGAVLTLLLSILCGLQSLWKSINSTTLTKSSTAGVALSEHTGLSVSPLSKLQGKGSFLKNKVAIDKLPTLIFKLNLNEVSFLTHSRTSLIISSVYGKYSLSPIAFVEASNKITTLRLTSVAGKANNLGWNVIPQQLYARDKAIRILLASWHMFSDSTQLAAGEYNFKRGTGDMTYANSLTLLPQQAKFVPSFRALSTAQGTEVSALAELASVNPRVSSALKVANFNFINLQPTVSGARLKTWSRV